ncbi:hypothetical protein BT63DRAFT_299656 [Microthyrium microscopicum]|uniref:Uncharacterized protein n=1 Tax=Microthyrium microscopicum TaxID=703497 RepID=A0A6A6U6F3_9PEZI|nr:hypothetical protein BT63DRAFT_299656 [Microthyrium microscopicum]
MATPTQSSELTIDTTRDDSVVNGPQSSNPTETAGNMQEAEDKTGLTDSIQNTLHGMDSQRHDSLSDKDSQEEKSHFTANSRHTDLESLADTGSSSQSRGQRYTSAVFESIGLAIVYNIIAKICKWQIKEEKKLVIGTSWKHRLVRCIFYLVPVFACIVLLAFNLGNYYIGGELSGAEGEDPQKLAALQFAAKLHELLMIASLVSILVTIIRLELTVKDGGLPFGAIFSPQQIQSIDILWSPEFWGTIKYSKKAEKPRRKVNSIIFCIIIFALLGLSVGPSSAILMRPRLQDWRAGGTPFWIRGTESLLFPSVISDSENLTGCITAGYHASCPSEAWETINQNLVSFWPRMLNDAMVPETVRVESLQSTRDLRSSTRSNNNTIFRNAYTVATVPVSFIADTLTELAKGWYLASLNSTSHLKFFLDVTHSVNAPQPMVVARCTRIPVASNQTTIAFPVLGSISLAGGTQPDAALGVLNRNVSDTSNGLAHNVTNFIQQALASPAPKPNLYWIDDPKLLQAADATLAIAAFIPAAGSISDSLYCCSMDSRFINATVYTLRTAIKVAQSTEYTGAGTIGTNLPKVYPSAAWSKYLNPIISGTNASIFETMAATAGLWSNESLPQEFLENTEPALEQMLAALLANGIGRLNYNFSLAGNQANDFGRQLLSKNGGIDFGGNAFVVTAAEQAQATKFQLEATVNGYAYATDGATQKAAITVLFLYSSTVIAYVIYLLCTKSPTTPSWGKPAEIAALAVNSDRADELRNTGAGISTVSVFENKVSIIAQGNHLQMVFGNEDGGGIVQRDRRYG